MNNIESLIAFFKTSDESLILKIRECMDEVEDSLKRAKIENNHTLINENVNKLEFFKNQLDYHKSKTYFDG